MSIITQKLTKEELKRYRDDFNRTHLSLEIAMQRIQLHRDYIAHAARYSHIIGKHVLSTNVRKLHGGQGPNILDIGCGPELQFLNSLHCNRAKCASYVGIEAAGKFSPRGLERLEKTVLSGKSNSLKNVQLYAATDFLTHKFNFPGGFDAAFDTIVCLEVIEHVQPRQAALMLDTARNFMHDLSVFWVSTPCYDEHVGAADNHPNEITYEALGALIEDLGFGIEDHWGTFASQKDYKHLIGDLIPEELFNKLSSYYDSTLVSNIFAPIVGPENSRNALWKLTKNQGPNYVRKFKPLGYVQGPWTSNDNWMQLSLDD